MIKIQQLDFGYKKSEPIFKNLSLEIDNGIYGLIGPNGVGKTTLFHLICGLLFPKKGTCEYLGLSSESRSPFLKRNIFYIADNYRLPIDNILKFVERHSAFYPNFDRINFEENLNDFQVSMNQSFSSISYGDRKKVLLAYALSLRTPLLLIDEVTNGLDVSAKTVFKKLITRTISDNQCLILSTHLPNEFETLLDHIIVLNKRGVLLNSSIENILDRIRFEISDEIYPQSLYTEESVFGYISILKNTENIDSRLNIELLYNALLKEPDIVKLITDKKDGSIF